MIWIVGIAWAVSAVIVLTVLLYLFFTQKKKFYFYFSLIFLLAHFSGLEYALWRLGENFFLLLWTNTPLLIYFLAWFLFTLYTSEKVLKDRKLTIFIILATALILYFAPLCMNFPTECKILDYF